MTSLTTKRRAKEEKARRVLQRDFSKYKQFVYRHYMHPPHLAMLDRYLMQVTRYAETRGAAGIGRLIVEMPPRHGKSVTVSRLYPTWHLGRNPDHRVMLVGYGASLAEKHSRVARNMMMQDRYEAVFSKVDANGVVYERIELATGSKSVQEWDIEDREGGASALGVGGAATGKGAHILLIDDPIKNREEAESEVIRDKIWDSYQDDLLTRLEPGAAVVIVHTRWHQDDLIGRLLIQEPDDWVRLRLPAIAEADDALGRQPGEPLWAERYPLAYLQKEEKRGLYRWSSLYQQNPVPGEGGFFKRDWFKTVSEPPNMVFASRYWDLAMSDKPTADYTVGLKIGLGTDGHYYILDVVRQRVDWGQLVGFMADVMLADGPAVSQGVEKAGYMTRAVSDLNADHRLHGYSVMGYDVDKKKHIRALPVQGKFQSGMISLVRTHWNESYIDELCAFTPKGAVHDDQVDATSGAWVMMDGQALMEGYTSW